MLSPSENFTPKDKRGMYDMIATVLLACSESTNRNQIMQRANLSYNGLKFYLGLALREHLVEELKDKTVLITARGRQYLCQYQVLSRLLAS